MLSFVTSLVCVSSGAFQDSKQSDDPSAVVEELIQRTNRLDAFRVVYRLSPRDEPDVLAEISYSDGLGVHLRVRAAESDESTSAFWAVDGELCSLVKWGEEVPSYGRFAMPELPGYVALEERFPSSLDGRLPPGPFLHLDCQPEAGSERVEFSLSAGWASSAHVALFGWLSKLRGHEELLQLDGDDLRVEHELYRMTISRSTGFITEITSDSDGESITRLRLDELDLEPTFEPDLFDLPDRPAGAEDITAEMERQMSSRFDPAYVRADCLKRIDRLIAGEHVHWGEETREGCEDVLRAHHEAVLHEKLAGTVEKVAEKTREFADSLAEARAGGADIEELRRRAADRRDALEEQLEGGLPKVLERFADPEIAAGESAHWSELLEIEGRVVEGLYDELFVQPVLDAFDAAIESTLDGGARRTVPDPFARSAQGERATRDATEE